MALVGGAAAVVVVVARNSGRAPGAAAPASSVGASASVDVVPWVDQPVSPPPVAPPPTPNPPAPKYPPCVAAQLTAATAGIGGATGNTESVVVFTNMKANCSLSGYPTSFVGVRADGSKQTLHPDHDGFFAEGYAWPADLGRGGTGKFAVSFTLGCVAGSAPDPSHAFISAVVGMPGGGAVTVPARFATTCGVSVTEFGQPAPPPPDLTGKYPGLTAKADLPGTVVAGATTHYTVTLTNTTGKDIRLDPCPVYAQGLYPPKQIQFFRLNCGGADTIPAHGSVTFAMQMPIPATVSGTAKFSWQIPGYADAFSGRALQVAPAPSSPPNP